MAPSRMCLDLGHPPKYHHAETIEQRDIGGDSCSDASEGHFRAGKQNECEHNQAPHTHRGNGIGYALARGLVAMLLVWIAWRVARDASVLRIARLRAVAEQAVIAVHRIARLAAACRNARLEPVAVNSVVALKQRARNATGLRVA